MAAIDGHIGIAIKADGIGGTIRSIADPLQDAMTCIVIQKLIAGRRGPWSRPRGQASLLSYVIAHQGAGLCGITALRETGRGIDVTTGHVAHNIVGVLIRDTA